MTEIDSSAPLDVHAPYQTNTLVGHEAAEAALLAAYKSGRIAHAWLLGGAQGIGKATLAYRMARFVLAHPDPASPEVQTATSLVVDSGSRAARMIAGGTHGGLLTLQRTLNDKGVLRSVITIEEVRQTVTFFGETAAADGWRVCIVDTMDDLNANGANALLKVLEEPPPRSLFLLVSHAPARLLPTIHSRCRKLNLRPLSPEQVARAVADATGLAPDAPQVAEMAALSDGSAGRALSIADTRAARLGRRVSALLNGLPKVDPLELHGLGDAMPLNDKATLAVFVGSVERWIEHRVAMEGSGTPSDLPRLARLAEVWDKIGRAARETADYNLERKPLVFSVVGMLAEAVA